MSELPEGWVEATLGELGQWYGGGTPSKDRPDFWTGGDIPWVSPKDMKRPVLDSAEDFITAAAVQGSATKMVPSRSVLMVVRSGILAHTFPVALNSVPVTLNQDMKAVHPTRTEPEFLAYGLRAYGPRILSECTKQGTTVASVSTTALHDLGFPLPPLNEQKRIVAKIDALTEKSREAREALAEVPELLDKLRQSILAAAFRGDLTKKWREQNPDVEPATVLLERIRAERRKKWEQAELAKFKAKGKVPTDDRWKEKYVEPEPADADGLPELPEGWCWATWREVGDSQNGRPFPSAEYQARGTRLLRPGNLNVNGWVEWTAANTRCMPTEYEAKNPDHVVGPGELVMNLTAQSLKDQFLGRVCLTRAGEHCLLNQRLARLTPTLLAVDYVFFWMKSPGFRRFVDDLNTGTLIQHMFTSQLDAHVLPVAPYTEQLEIAAVLRRMDQMFHQVATTHSSGEETLEALQSSILAKAFRGELVPQDPNDEPASVLLDRIRAEKVASESTLKQSRRTKRA